MAKKLKAGKGVEQKEARVVLTARTMQKNVQSQFDLVKAGLSGSVKKKYNPEPEISAMVGMVDTVPAVAKYVFKQAQPLLESNNVKSSKVGVKIVVEVVKAQPEGADDALRMMKSLLISRNSSEMTQKAAVKVIIEVVREVPQLAKSALGQIQPLLKSKEAGVAKMATEIIVKMVKVVPQVEVVQEALEVVQGLLGGKNADSFKTVMKIMAEVVKIAPAVPQIEGGILKTLVTIVRTTPEVEVAKEVLELANSLIESGDTSLIQTAARVITNVVKIVPHKAVIKEALQIVKPLLQGESADFMKVALDTITSIVQLAPSVALAKHVFKLTQPLLESNNADFVQMATKTVMEVVRTLPQVEIAQEALSLVQILIANKNVEAAGMALEVIVKAVPQIEIAHRALNLMQPLLESDNPAFVKMATKTVMDVVKTLPQVEIAQEALSLVQILISNKNIGDAKMALEVIVKAVPQVEVAHRVLSLMPPLLESDNANFVQVAAQTVTDIVRTLPQVEIAQEALSLMPILIANKNIFAATMKIEAIVRVMPKIEVAHKALSLVQPLLGSDNPHFVKMAVGTLKEVVKIVPQTEVAHASLALVQTLIANKNTDAAQETIEVIVKAVPEAEIAQRALGLAQPLLESNNSAFIQAGVKMMVVVVKAMPKVEVVQEALSLVQILIANKNIGDAQMTVEGIVKTMPKIEVALKALSLLQPLLESSYSAYGAAQVAMKTMTEVVQIVRQTEVAQASLNLVEILIASKKIDYAYSLVPEAIAAVLKVVPKIEIVHRVLNLVQPLLESDNPAFIRMATETMVGAAKSMPKAEIVREVLERMKPLLENKDAALVQIASRALKDLELVADPQVKNNILEARSTVVTQVEAPEILKKGMSLLSSNDHASVSAGAKIITKVVKAFPNLADEAYAKLEPLRNNKTKTAADAVIEQIVWALPQNSLVAIKEKLANQNKKILKSHENWDGEMRAVGPRVIGPLAEIVQALPELEEWALKIVESLSANWRTIFARSSALEKIAKMVQENPRVSKIGFELFLQVIASGISSLDTDNAMQSIAEIVKVDSSLADLSLPHIKKLHSGSGPKVLNSLLTIAKSAPHLVGEMFEQVKICAQARVYQTEAVVTAAEIVKLKPSLARDALDLHRTVDIIGDYQKLAKAIAEIVKAAPNVAYEAFELLSLKFNQMGAYKEVAEIILDIVQAVPELAPDTLDLLAKSLLGKGGHHSVLYNTEALRAIAEIVKVAPDTAKKAFEMTRKLLKMDNAGSWYRSEYSTAEEALKTLAKIVNVEQSLAGAAFDELMQENPLFGSFVVASTTRAIAEIVTIKPSLASTALKLLIPVLDNKNLYYDKKIVAASVAKMVQADPLVATEVLELVKPLFDGGQLDVAVEITVSVVEVVPDLATEVVKTIEVLLTSGSTHSEFSADKLLKAMPGLFGKVINLVEQLRDKSVIKGIYEHHAKKVIDVQVQEHLALGYLGVDDVLPHITKVLGVVDEYVTLGDDLVC